MFFNHEYGSENENIIYKFLSNRLQAISSVRETILLTFDKLFIKTNTHSENKF